jgi:hypothetical protein
MSLMELIENGLKQGGYDGLFNPGACACKLDDLAPCGCLDAGVCEPGVFVEGPCDECAGGKPCDFHIGPNAEAHGQAVARPVQPLVRNSESTKGE